MKTGQIEYHAGQSPSCKPTIEMLTTCDRMRVQSHPSRLGLDARHMIHLAGNEMTADPGGRAYPMLWDAVGIAALVHAFRV